ncbi:MAG: methyl-accepting chemotaxis protein [Spirochaetaceae bacterium]|jgi:methyl-accepting chemotaxis protein|nr:methyl-accepting chemotaxis protein [Spirochaetaceae bacterium]
MKIGKKLVLMIVILNLAGTGVLTGTILRLAQKQVKTLITSEITHLANEEARGIQIWMEVYLDMARTLSQLMTRYGEIDRDARRPLFNMMLRALLAENPEITAISTTWEPNVLDGRDGEFANTRGTDGSGRFIPYWFRSGTGIDVEPLVDYEVPGKGDYFLLPKQNGTEILVEPYEYMIDGRKVLLTTAATPIKSGDRFAGTVNIDITMDDIQKKLEQIKPYKGTVAFVYSNGGLVAGHFDPERLGKPMAETEKDIAGPYLADLQEAVRKGEALSFTNYVPPLKESMFFVNVPLHMGRSLSSWSLMLGIPSDLISAPIYRMLIAGIVIAVLMLLVISAGALLLSRTISNPLKRMVAVLGDIGEGDLTKRLEARSKDEIGDMTRSFNGTLDKIKNLVLIIREKARSLSKTGTELSTNMTETAAAINEITANIQSIKGRVVNQSAGVTETNSTMEQITAHINRLNGHIEEQTISVSQSSSAIEQMLANIQAVTHTLVKNAGNVSALASASEIGRSGLQGVAGDIQEIARESEGLLEINAVMENIASQTNLLSMNAAIEAAHAGEAGKGFAVVADEIRKLAENSGEQSRTISGVLKKIKGSIDKITSSTGEVLNKFEAIDSGVRIVSEQEENIRSAMEEQNTGSRQILDAIGRLNDITKMVKGGSMEMLEGSKEVIQESKNLEALTQEIANGMNEMASGAEEINIAVNQVNTISGENKESIETLVEEVSKFKMD